MVILMSNMAKRNKFDIDASGTSGAHTDKRLRCYGDFPLHGSRSSSLSRKRLSAGMDFIGDLKRPCTQATRAYFEEPAFVEEQPQRALISHPSTLIVRTLSDPTPTNGFAIVPYNRQYYPQQPPSKCTIEMIDSDDEEQMEIEIQ
jgi:hypothetical protein